VKLDHGSSTPAVMSGLITALILNGTLAAGILLASQVRSDAMAAQVVAEQSTQSLQCRYIENARLYQLEVTAEDWQAAEAMVCGAKYRNVRVPPLLAMAYAALLSEPEQDAILLAQRESCSCSDGERVPVLQDIGIVQAPRLGTKPKQNALPEIVNRPEAVERNAVDPDAKPQARPETPKKRDTKREVDVNALLDAASVFDDARPSNDRNAAGDPDGSRFSTSATGQGDPYLQKVKAKLDNSMNAPASIPKSELKKLKARIWIKIGATGSIADWDFVSRSGNTAFDGMVERSIKRFALGGDAQFPSPDANWSFKRIQIDVDGSQIR
jgi:outer membrane biosynthesis protein TonB